MNKEAWAQRVMREFYRRPNLNIGIKVEISFEDNIEL